MIKGRKLSWLERGALIVQIPVVLGFLLSVISWYVNPAHAGWLGVFGLAFPVFLLLQTLFTLYWMVRLKRPAIGSVIILALGWGHYAGLFQWSGDTRQIEQTRQIRVFTHNVHGWKPTDSDAELREARKGMQRTLDQVNADIYFLQENNEKEGLPRPKLSYSYRESMFDDGSVGLAIWSRYPIIKKGRVDYAKQRGGYRAFTWADIVFNSDTIRLINAHLVSTGLAPESYWALQTISSENMPSSEQLEEESRDIFRRLSDAYRIRGTQITDLLSFIDNTPYPIILAGDLNDTPDSYSYRQLCKRLNDTFIQSGSGTGNTFVKMKLLPLRIDYLFIDQGLKAYNHKVMDDDWSDHLPVVADVDYVR